VSTYQRKVAHLKIFVTPIIPSTNIYAIKDGKYYVVWSNDVKNDKLSIYMEKVQQIRGGVSGIGKRTVGYIKQEDDKRNSEASTSTPKDIVLRFDDFDLCVV
jgi:hypothetical protein